jgi:predicted GIY-YIG superfamily endonuclease
VCFNISVAKSKDLAASTVAIRLVYYESFDDVHKAIGREKQLKGWSRAKKIALIESKNLRWRDFAEKWGAEMLFAGESIHKLSS